MKRHGLIVLLIFLFAVGAAYPQVAVNNTGASAENCAILDVNATDKGLLLPRIVLTDLNSSAPVEASTIVNGLLVYNTGGVNDIDEGFYFWNNEKWNLLTTSSTPITQIQMDGLYQAAEIYEDNYFGSPTVLSLESSAEFYGWVSALEGESFGDTYVDVTDPVADKIVIGEDGLYEIDLSASFGGTNNAQISATIFHTPVLTGTSAGTKVRFLVKLKSNGDLEGSNAHGLLMLKKDDYIDLRFNSTTSFEELYLYNISLIVNKVGEYE